MATAAPMVSKSRLFIVVPSSLTVRRTKQKSVKRSIEERLAGFRRSRCANESALHRGPICHVFLAAAGYSPSSWAVRNENFPSGTDLHHPPAYRTAQQGPESRW